MPNQRVIKGILHNFLGTYTSRYSNFNGYWLWGYLVIQSDPFCFNLLENIPSDGTPLGVAKALAASTFQAQMAKQNLDLPRVSDASVCIAISPLEIAGQFNAMPCRGHIMQFKAQARMVTGFHAQHTQSRFVAPHRPSIEMQSAYW